MTGGGTKVGGSLELEIVSRNQHESAWLQLDLVWTWLSFCFSDPLSSIALRDGNVSSETVQPLSLVAGGGAGRMQRHLPALAGRAGALLEK